MAERLSTGPVPTVPANDAARYYVGRGWVLLGTLFGGVLAVLLVPLSGHEVQYALTLPAAVLSIGLVVGLAFSATVRPAGLLRAESILTVGIVYWILLDPIQGAYELWGTSREAVQLAFAATAIFAAGIWIGSAAMSRRIPQVHAAMSQDLAPRLVFYAGILTFAAGVMRPVIACQFSPGCFVEALYTRWDEVPWRTFRASEGGTGLNTLLRYTGIFGYMTLPLSAVLRRLEGRWNWRVVLLGILGVIVLLLLVQSGARRIVGMVVAATVLVWILTQPEIRWRHLIRLGMFAAVLLLLLEAMVSWRTIGIGTGLATGAPLGGKGQGMLSVDKNLHYMTHAMTVIPERHPYKPVDGILATLGAPVPRTIWPSKPGAAGINLLPLIGERRAPGFSWTCSAVCDFYVMGGLWVVAVGGMLFGLFAGLANRLLFRPPSTRSRLLYAFSVMILFVGLRAIRDLSAIGLFVLICMGLILVAQRYAGRPYTPA